GRRAEHPATPHGSERCNASPAQHQQQWRLALALCSHVALDCKGSFAAERLLADEAKPLVLPDDQAGSRPGSRRFFIRFRHQRRVAIDGDHVKSRCNGNGHGNGHGNGQGNGNGNGNGHGHGQGNGHGHGQGNGHGHGHGNGRYAERQRQRQRSLRGTSKATATVAARNVKGRDPLLSRVTLRYTCCASTQGERGREDTTADCNRNGNSNCRAVRPPCHLAGIVPTHSPRYA
ncbi:MAG: hypothetical protein JWM30_4034, partial [Burkholderia sp.]|nr:hypothetical protein [Burkholderia sp.]